MPALMPAPKPAILSVQHLTKDFPGLRALDDVSMAVRQGEILALLGQNGSGKSTLVKVMAGVYTADTGEVTIHAHDGSACADQDRLHFIHQDLGLVESLSTVENLSLGRPTAGGALSRLRRRAESEQARQELARFGASFDVDLPVGRLTPAQRTIVAIARAMDGWSTPHSVLVLDEPTASLHGEEVGVLFTAVRAAARRGAGVVFISHRLGEVVELADRVVVLRDGRLVADVPAAHLSVDQLAALITGRPASTTPARSPGPPAAADRPALKVRGLSGGSLREFDLQIGAGEVVGIAGSLGSGREQVAGLIFGSLRREAGAVKVADRLIGRSTPHESIRNGLVLVPADRRAHGGVMTHSVQENLVLPELRSISRAGGLHVSRAQSWAETVRWSRRVGVRPMLPRRALGLFSGGNQQKIMIARWLRTAPAVLLAEEPTQGVDIEASEAIRALIVDAAERGTAVLVTSSDNTDLIQMCSRVIVLRDGVRTCELHGATLTDQRLTEECLGVSPHDLVTAGAHSQEASDG